MASSWAAEDMTPAIECLISSSTEKPKNKALFEPPHRHPTRLPDIDEEDEKDDNSSCGSWQAVSDSGGVKVLEDEMVEEVLRPSRNDYKEFYSAVILGDIAVLEAKLDLGLDVDRETPKGFTALVIAILEMHVEVVKLLLEKSADVNHRVKNLPPLVHAVTREKHGPELLQLLIDHGANPNAVSSPDRKNALHWAATEGRVETVEFLIGKGMDMEETCRRGFTPLLLAAENGQTEVAEVLLRLGAKLNVTSENGGSPLIWSSCKNHVDTVKFWLEQDVDVNARDDNGLTSMFLACHFGCLEIVNLLLDKGADVSILSRNPEKFSAVMAAAWSDQAAVIETLIAHGYDLDIKNNAGESALDLAINQQQHKSIRVLLEAMGGETYPKDSISLRMALADGHEVMKALISAASLMYPHIGSTLEDSSEFAWMKWVLFKGGDLVRKRAMLKLVHVALEDQNIGMVNALIEQGCDINVLLSSGHTPLLFAVGHRNLELIRTLLKAGADPNKPSAGSQNYTPFDCAIIDMENDEDSEVADLLLKSGRCRINCGKNPVSTAFSYILSKAEDWSLNLAERLAIRMIDSIPDVNVDKCSDGCSLLHVATLREREDFIDLLLRKGADIESRDKSDVTPFLMACQLSPKMIPILIERGANIDVKYKANAGALVAAAVHGNVESLQFLINYGFDIEAQTEKGYTPLACALTWSQEEAALYLMRQGANVHWKTQNKEQTALHFAAKQGLDRVVEELLSQGVDVNAKDNEGWTPLHEACATGTTKIVRMLLDAGADIELELPNKDRPLHVALINEQENRSRLLLKRGADVTARAFKNRTPLHITAEYNLPNVARLLLDMGLSTEDIDDETWTPLCCCGFPEVVKILLARGANVNYADKDNWTPLHQAVFNEDIETASVLLEAGANIDVRTTDDGLSVLERARDLLDYRESEKFVRMLSETMLWRKEMKDLEEKEKEFEGLGGRFEEI